MIATPQKPRSPIVMMRREFKELLDGLAPNSPTRVRCCAAFLERYFAHWRKWKEAHYPISWIYQPLTEIRHDLMDAYTVHVVREAIALLEKLGFLSVRKNDRTTNYRNGQDRTHQYLLHSDRIELALENRYTQPTAETLETTPFVNSDICSVNGETPNVNGEIGHFFIDTHTQIPYTDSCFNSCSLSEEREKLEFQWGEEEIKANQRELKSIEEVVAQDKRPEQDKRYEVSCDNNINSGEEQYSAAPALKSVELAQDDVKPLVELKSVELAQDDVKPLVELKSVELAQDDVKPLVELKSDRVPLGRSADRSSGFQSDDERKGFYEALLELGKSKGVRSPVAWSATIIKNIDVGDPCQYLIEYREGLLVGACEKQEWEIAPGQPYEQFLTYLKIRNKKTGMTDEQAIAEVHRQLKDINLAKSLWESCKRVIAKYQEDWEQQKRLGVQNAYLPPELLPQRDVSLEEVTDAMENLQSGCVQLAEIAESRQNFAFLPTEPEKAETELQQTLELPSEPTPELESVTEPEQKPTITELQEKLNLPIGASLIRMMVKANPDWGYRVEDNLVLPSVGTPTVEHLRSLLDNKITASRAQRLVNQNPEWGFVIDEDGRLWDF